MINNGFFWFQQPILLQKAKFVKKRKLEHESTHTTNNIVNAIPNLISKQAHKQNSTEPHTNSTTKQQQQCHQT